MLPFYDPERELMRTIMKSLLAMITGIGAFLVVVSFVLILCSSKSDGTARTDTGTLWAGGLMLTPALLYLIYVCLTASGGDWPEMGEDSCDSTDGELLRGSGGEMAGSGARRAEGLDDMTDGPLFPWQLPSEMMGGDGGMGGYHVSREFRRGRGGGFSPEGGIHFHGGQWRHHKNRRNGGRRGVTFGGGHGRHATSRRYYRSRDGAREDLPSVRDGGQIQVVVPSPPPYEEVTSQDRRHLGDQNEASTPRPPPYASVAEVDERTTRQQQQQQQSSRNEEPRNSEQCPSYTEAIRSPTSRSPAEEMPSELPPVPPPAYEEVVNR
ncbi:uncharacterized protein LOC144908629 isoform X1 [Branchiostoma floridae x Branchiostoma belcheri]